MQKIFSLSYGNALVDLSAEQVVLINCALESMRKEIQQRLPFVPIPHTTFDMRNSILYIKQHIEVADYT